MKKFKNLVSSIAAFMILAASILFGGDGVLPVVDDKDDAPVVDPFEPVVDPVDDEVEPVVPADNPSSCDPRSSSPWQKPIYYGRSSSKSPSGVGGGRILRRLFGR